MNEGDEPKSKPTPSVPPDRAAALARKLTSGRSIPPALGKLPTEPPNSVPSVPPKSSEPPPVSKRDAVLAARRASLAPALNPQATPGAPRPESKRPPPKPRTRKSFLMLGGVLLVALLAAGGLYAKRAMYERSDEGRVHTQLLAWEFGPREPAAREAAFGEIDRMGPAAVSLVIDKLADGSVAVQGSSHSTHTIQQVAHLYLMRLATTHKLQPPKQAEELEKTIFEGASPAPPQWNAARDAWRAWYADQQARGALPK